MYILTLGVLPGYQKQGIATTLIHWLEELAESIGVHALFLHVITYNNAAMRLYEKCQFQCVACLENFYNIRSGRQIDPNRTQYDAYLFLKWTDAERRNIGPWEGAVGPFRHAFYHWNMCFPWVCRQQCMFGVNVPYYFRQQSVQNVAFQGGYRNPAATESSPSQSNGMFYRLFGRRNH